MSETAATDHPAVLNVADKARADRQSARERLAAFGIEHEAIDVLVDTVRSAGRLTLNFHPDRRDRYGRTVAAGLLDDGRYRSQFETGISNGGRFAVPGGDRPRWEQLLFGGSYDNVNLVRPVYGALDLFRDPYGGAPRFGSSFVVLAPHCWNRATLCVGDSHLGPSDVGTAAELRSIIAGALDECASGDGFGRGLSAEGLLDNLATSPHTSPSARELDRYIEAQVHGGIELARDVESVRIDPSFLGSEIEEDLVTAAERYGFELGWTEGSEVYPDDIDPTFRGPEIPELARRVAGSNGAVDAAAIGVPLAALPFTEPTTTGDSETSDLQRYKKLWHCCLKFGRPVNAAI